MATPNLIMEGTPWDKLRTALLLPLLTIVSVASLGCGANTASVVAAPLALTCSSNPGRVMQGQPSTITASLVHPSSATTAIHFSATDGQLQQTGNSATLTSTGLTPRTVTVTCAATDDTGQTASATAPVMVQAAPSTTATTLTVTPATGFVGGLTTLTAGVTAEGPVTSGTLTFFDGTQAMGTFPLSTTGAATLSTTTLAQGSHTFSATYNGIATALTSSSAAATTFIAPDPVPPPAPTVSCFASPTSVAAGQPSTITASGASASGHPLSFSFTSSAGLLGATGSTAVLKTIGLPPSVVTVACQATDDAGRTASSSASIAITPSSASTAVAPSPASTAVTPSPVTTAVTSTPVTTAVTPAPVSTAVTPSPVATAVIPSPVTTAVTPAPVTTAVIPTPVTTAVTPAPVTAAVTPSPVTAAVTPAPVTTAVIPTPVTTAVTPSPVTTAVTPTPVTTAVTPTPVTTAVTPTPVSTTLTLTVPATGTTGHPVTLNAVLTSASGSPAGAVTFTDGGVFVGTANVSASGNATLIASNLAAGTHLLTASYSGTSTMAPSSSAPATLVVSAPPQPPGIACSATPSSVKVGQIATILATAVNPSNRTLTFHFSASAGTLSQSGSSAVLSSTGQAAGIIGIACQLTDDLGETATASTSVTLTPVTSPTTTTLIATPNTPTVGQAVTFNASVIGATSGTISFLDGTSPLGSAQVSSSGYAVLVTSSLSQGTHTLAAAFAGTDAAAPSTSAPVTLVVSPAPLPPTISCSASPSSIRVGQTATITASAASPSNRALTTHFSASAGALSQSGTSATFTSNGLAAGTVSISCQVTDDLGQTASSSTTLTLSLPPATTATILTASPAAVTVGNPVTLNASIPGANAGTVTFSDGGTPLGSAQVSSSGYAVLVTSSLSQGTHTLAAAFAGTDAAAPSTSAPVTLVVSPAPLPPTISCSASPSSIRVGQTATITASAASPSNRALTTHFSASAGALSQSGSSATFTSNGLDAGQVTITCEATDDLGQSASANTSVTLNSTPAPTTTILAAPSPATVGQPVTLSANVTGATSGTINFLDGASPLGSAPISTSGVATLVTSVLAKGTHTLSAAFAGTASLASSTSVPVSLVVSPAPLPPTVGCSATPSSINLGDTATIATTSVSPSNRSLTVSFAAPTGSLATNAATALWSSAGSPAGSAVITCTATDDLGQTASATTTVWVNAGQGEQALTAYNFTDSVGVNVHLHFGNTGYVTDFPDVLKSMVALGVHHYRNGVDPYAQPFEFANAEALAAVGIKGDWLIDRSDTAQNINAISSSAPNSVEAFEGPNEDDIDAGTVLSNFVELLHDTVRGNPKTAAMPIYAPTLTQGSSISAQASVAAYVDYGNMHDYYFPRNPETPAYGGTLFGCGGYGSMAFNLCVTGVIAPGRPIVSTETGYISGTQSDAALGRYFPRLLFAHLGMHVMRTYIYELLENVDSPGYGLLHGDFSPKPGYTAIQSLISLFKDENFTTPGKLQFNLTGQLNNVQHVLFQKRDGTYMLAIWLGVPSANGSFPYETYSVTPQVVNIATQTPVGSATFYTLDDEGNLAAQAGTTSGSSTSVAVGDKVTIISFAPSN